MRSAGVTRMQICLVHEYSGENQPLADTANEPAVCFGPISVVDGPLQRRPSACAVFGSASSCNSSVPIVPCSLFPAPPLLALAQPACGGHRGSRQGDAGRRHANRRKGTAGPGQGTRPARAVLRRPLHLRQSRFEVLRRQQGDADAARCRRARLRAGDAADRRRLCRGQGRAEEPVRSLQVGGDRRALACAGLAAGSTSSCRAR